jgi:hemerythrin-like metal-binding protein
MASIEWDTHYCTGIPLLDTQNKHFIEILNQLLDQQATNNDRHVLCLMFGNLLGFVQEHFRQEELFYEQYHLDELSEHRQQHFLFQENLNFFYRDVVKEQNQDNVSKELCEYLRDWAVFHVAYVDKSMAHNIKSLMRV